MRTSGSKAALVKIHLLVSVFDSEVHTNGPRMLMNFGIGTLVPRTRSSHKFAELSDANFGFKGGISKDTFASVRIRFRSSYEWAANAYELRNRDTSAANPKFAQVCGALGCELRVQRRH